MEEWVMLCSLFSESRVSVPTLWIRAILAAFEQVDQEEEEHDPTLKDRREQHSHIMSDRMEKVRGKIKELKNMRIQLEQALRLTRWNENTHTA